jgi:hypothetical protein
MSALVVVAAGFCGLVLALVAFSLFALLRTRFLVETVRRETRDTLRVRDSAIEALGSRMDALAARIEDVRTVSHGAPTVPERSGINLSRRSQALRLHRRGEPADQIATTLGIPVQEVQLLIRVHEIVMSTV